MDDCFMCFGWHILSLHSDLLPFSLLSLSNRGSGLPCGKGPLLCLTCCLWLLECTMVHPHKAPTYPPGRFAAPHFLWEGRRCSSPSPWQGPGPSSVSPDQLHSCFRLHQGKASLILVLLLSHWNVFELAEQLCGSPHFPLFKAFSLTSFYCRDKVWLVSQCMPGRREATAKARRSAPFLAWILVRWGWSMCSSQHPMCADSLFPPYFAIGGAAAWFLRVTHIRLLSSGAGRPASSTAESYGNKGHFKSGDKADF